MAWIAKKAVGDYRLTNMRAFSGSSQRLSVLAMGTKEAGRQEREGKRFKIMKTPSASYSVTLRVEYPNHIGGALFLCLGFREDTLLVVLAGE